MYEFKNALSRNLSIEFSCAPILICFNFNFLNCQLENKTITFK